MKHLFSLLLLSCVGYAQAKDIIITVGGGNGTMVFNPQNVNATVEDVVVFQFTNGTHSATQSEFPTPCIPASQTNSTVNGFDSGLRPAVNPPTELRVTISANNTPLWFFDSANGSCGMGGVGVINVNESSFQTLEGFVRNAERLNGTQATQTTSSPASTPTNPASGSGSGSGSSASTSASPTKTSEASKIFWPTMLSTLLVSFALVISVM